MEIDEGSFLGFDTPIFAQVEIEVALH